MDRFTIVVGYDGSRTSSEALKVAIFHARHFNAFVHVVYSVPEGHEGRLEEIESARAFLSHAESILRDNDIPCEVHLLVRGSSPGKNLVEFARDCRADEIIIGVRRRSRVEKFVFGSTANYVILHAQCPVVAVK
ncbi:universal stress protein [Thermodesulforhabdus norvegica]|uniref:Nucleotide-binding universal stress protein, UspA family n=1 Tax=Thermodesulforhabdus norvegica TaxID=39841 RepID=A0A1I4ULZ5_9BACT|nr:universal stress protein [Thermodesulforhabdus norvegica]SFM89986.1 Nucleotide-binding universal stress protein, UspA family [Thermodesulforhabdus norvegica]